MASEMVTPVDQITGIPLPIVPNIERLPLKKPNIADWHHAFHPREDPQLKTVGGLALRNSRIQLVSRDLHNEGPRRYHKFFDGPPIPESEAAQFGLCVLACAGYIPADGIDLSSGEPKVVHLNHNQRNILKAHKQYSFDYRYFRYGYDPIRKFFAKYILEQELTQIIPELMMEEFLYTRKDVKRRELGRNILELATLSATEQVGAPYEQLMQQGHLHELMPPNPQTLVSYKLGQLDHQESAIFPELTRQLRQKIAV